MLRWTSTFAFFALLAQGAHADKCEIKDGNKCPLDQLPAPGAYGNIDIYPNQGTRCAFDNFDEKGIDYETKSTYNFQLFPNLKNDKSKLMIYLQGGGACFDDLTCSFSMQCALGDMQTFTQNVKPVYSGFLNRTDDKNMFKDWNVVHLPYCTGDLHVGNRVMEPMESGLEDFLGHPECAGHDMPMYLNGYNNTKTVLAWAHENFPNPDEIVVSGYSAGALGVQILSSFIADIWKVDANDIKYSLIVDSYVGVLPETHPASEVLDYFGTCDLPLALSEDFREDCNSGEVMTQDLVAPMIREMQTHLWLFITSKADHTQRYFYQAIKDTLLGYPFTDLISGSEFYDDVEEIFDEYDNTANFAEFVIEGDQHVFVTDDDYVDYESINGEKLGPFLTKWLASTPNNATSGSGSGSVGSGSGAPSDGSVGGDADTPSDGSVGGDADTPTTTAHAAC